MSSLEHPYSSPRRPSESGPSAQGAPLPVTPPYNTGVGQYQANAPNSGVEGSGNSRKIKARERVKVACNHCRSRKIKCDAERPFCTGCVRAKRVHLTNTSKERACMQTMVRSLARPYHKSRSGLHHEETSKNHWVGLILKVRDMGNNVKDTIIKTLPALLACGRASRIGFGTNPHSPTFGTMSRINNPHVADMSPPQHATPPPPSLDP
ncbi:hypothetical protein BS47DRAFT_1382301 [Hydnum rufescens UP504]|uniref:Zn(2)-C6 fungal-type domain-containing protein n=1 Tax=Hydnum rufescens UP504 TaxID=1448309 RepID=A0A9P6AY38_9AGAM|nr:hypothetical protein BS47DRAFT_1382301 [Hydnum rufescens UP504]